MLVVKASRQTRIPPGVYVAVCCGVVDVGTHVGKFGKSHDVVIMWELIGVGEESKTRVISRRCRFSFEAKSTLRRLVENWLGRRLTEQEAVTKGFDLATLVGLGAQVQVGDEPNEAGGTTTRVVAVLPLPAGQRAPVPSSTVVFSITDEGLPDGLPTWQQELIQTSAEWASAADEADKAALAADETSGIG